MSRRPLFFLLLAATLATTIDAQSVHLRGKVENGEGACYYCPGFDYVIDVANYPITSSVYNLGSLIGLQIEATGQWNGSFAAPVVDITSLALVNESFSIGGGGSVGGRLKFTATSTPGDSAILTASLGAGFVPLFPTHETFVLDPSTFVVLGSRVMGGNGEATFEIPAVSSALAGVDVFGQALVLPQNGAPAYLTNADFKNIRP